MGLYSAPKPPDPQQTADAQAEVNRETAITQYGLNATNQVTPYGNLTYSNVTESRPQLDDSGNPVLDAAGNPIIEEVPVTWADGTPRFQAEQTLSPNQQGLLDRQEQAGLAFGDTALGQLGRVSDTLSAPFSTEGVGPGRVTSVGGNYLAGAQSQVPVSQNAYNRAVGASQGALTSNIDFAPFMTEFARNGQGFQQGIGDTGAVQQGIDLSGLPALQGRIGQTAGNITYNAGQQDAFADVGGPNRQVNFGRFGDPNISRDNVEQALFDRLNPQIDQRREQVESQLASQGLVPGTAAYDRAYDALNREVNDLRLATTAQAGAEQSRLANLGFTNFQLENDAQNQDFGQQLTRADFGNRARLTNASFNNQAQAQDFGQQQTRASFGNQARGQGVGEQIAAGQFGNQAQQQRFNQAMGRADLNNQTQAAINAEDLTRANFANRGNQANIDAARNNAVLNNSVQAQRFGQAADTFGMSQGLFDQAFGIGQAGLSNAITQGNFQNNAQDQVINDLLMDRQVPLNELNALLSGTQVSNPQFVNTPQTQLQAPDIAGMTYANFAQESQNRNSLIGGLTGLAGTALGGWASNGFGT